MSLLLTINKGIKVSRNTTTTTIYLDEPLYGINKIHDYIDFKTGKRHNMLAKASNVITSITTLSSGLQGGYTADEFWSLKKQESNTYNTLCNKAILKTLNTATENTYYENPVNFVFVGSADDTLETLKAKYDGAEVYYELEIPTEEDVDLPDLPLHSGTNIITYGTDVQPYKSSITYLQKTSRVEGISRDRNSSSSAWTREKDGVGKVANATHDGSSVTNDFDNLYPWCAMKTCNYDINTNRVTAWLGDSNFKWDGSNGDVYTWVPPTHLKIYQDSTKDYIYSSETPRTGYIDTEGFYVARYNGSVVTSDGKLHSYSGLVPTVNRTRASFRTLANNLGSNFSLLDWRYFIIQALYLIEYANYNSQSKLGNGIMNRKNLTALIAESSTNRAIVSSSTGYYVGQTIRIGTSDGGTQVANGRTITKIESYSDGTVTGYALTFDGAAVNIAVGNYICTMAQMTGQCDSLGMKSGCLNNDGYHSVIYRGIENIFANIWQWVDGINVQDRLAYICTDHTQYADDVFTSPYKALGYTNGTSNGWAKTLGFDYRYPLFRFPTTVGGSSSTYMTDYYYQNTGNRVARVGGDFGSGTPAGLWYWYFSSSSSASSWNIGCRLLIDSQ